MLLHRLRIPREVSSHSTGTKGWRRGFWCSFQKFGYFTTVRYPLLIKSERTINRRRQEVSKAAGGMGGRNLGE